MISVFQPWSVNWTVQPVLEQARGQLHDGGEGVDTQEQHQPAEQEAVDPLADAHADTRAHRGKEPPSRLLGSSEISREIARRTEARLCVHLRDVRRVSVLEALGNGIVEMGVDLFDQLGASLERHRQRVIQLAEVADAWVLSHGVRPVPCG